MNELIATLVANSVCMKIWSEDNAQVFVEFDQFRGGRKVIQLSADYGCLSNEETTKMLQAELDEFLEFGI